MVSSSSQGPMGVEGSQNGVDQHVHMMVINSMEH